ncbi:aminopeptidase P [Terriglobus roseus DSM 18391]|uniref:Xaa-Pro aminopeptidase n=1 Tax=Terriglobus roseus (strain DSM 18391 / NRRL B-41598 / KBS 63) TaxID=926566 RepID=I3ZDQ1_TERRK|nr:aminopeptidase P N-terminal domain-containing protein [Terriglobus roseus]AFL87369.1 aminopeptidase P [Terriglobus roseus DSM 18391]
MHRSSLLLPALLGLLSLTASALEKPSADELHARRVALASKLNGGVAVLFAAEEPLLDFTPFRQDSSFYYLTGWTEPGAALVIEAALPEGGDAVTGVQPAESYREVLFLPTRNLRMEGYTGRKLDTADPNAAKTAGVDEVRPMSQLVAELDRLTHGDVRHNYGRRAGLIYGDHTVPQMSATMTLLSQSLGMGTSLPLHDVMPALMLERQTKSPAELALLQKAADASVAAHRDAMKNIKPNLGENVIEGQFYAKVRAQGCERTSYASIVGSGPFSTQLHYSDDSRVMRKGDLVVIDAGCEYSMYAADITRTMPVDGHFTARQREIYNIVLGAQRAAAAAFVSGKSTLGSMAQRTGPDNPSLDRVAFEYINTHGKDLHGEPLGKYFLHGLGHSVGIDVHDGAQGSYVMQPGSVFTIEPGIYLPEENLGVRIEDTFYVDASGKLVNMSADLAHTPEEVEAGMRGK